MFDGVVDWTFSSATDSISEEPERLAKDCVRCVLATLPQAGRKFL
jgi:hypothetical protein